MTDRGIIRQQTIIEKENYLEELHLLSNIQRKIFEQKINKYSLNFLDKNLEKNYQEYNNSKKDERKYYMAAVLSIWIINCIITFLFVGLHFDIVPSKILYSEIIIKIITFIIEMIQFLRKYINWLDSSQYIFLYFFAISIQDLMIWTLELKSPVVFDNPMIIISFGRGVQFLCGLKIYFSSFLKSTMLLIISYIFPIFHSYFSVKPDCKNK